MKDEAAAKRKKEREAKAEKEKREKIYQEVRAEKFGAQGTPETGGRIRSNLRQTPPRRPTAAVATVNCDE